jgi:hypothetical protein
MLQAARNPVLEGSLVKDVGHALGAGVCLRARETSLRSSTRNRAQVVRRSRRARDGNRSEADDPGRHHRSAARHHRSAASAWR